MTTSTISYKRLERFALTLESFFRNGKITIRISARFSPKPSIPYGLSIKSKKAKFKTLTSWSTKSYRSLMPTTSMALQTEKDHHLSLRTLQFRALTSPKNLIKNSKQNCSSLLLLLRKNQLRSSRLPWSLK